MKKNIVVCCGEMLKALCRSGLIYDGRFAITNPGTATMGDYRYCPWCGAKLPFPYEGADAPAS